jgi:hypothetical protein
MSPPLNVSVSVLFAYSVGQTDGTVAKTGSAVNRSFPFLYYLHQDHDTHALWFLTCLMVVLVGCGKTMLAG